MRTLRILIVHAAAVLAAAASFTLAGSASPAGQLFAIKGARVVTGAGTPIDNGVILMRDGIIENVGAGLTVPPDAIVTDGTGLTVYPGLIDMGNDAPLGGAPADAGGGRGGGGGAAPAPTFATLEEAERVKRTTILRPDFMAASNLRHDNPALGQLAAAGITSVLAVPASGIFKGQSALVNVAVSPDDPQISTIADYRTGLGVVKSPVALHVNMGGRGGGQGYPGALLGTIAFTKQGFLDGQWQRDAQAQYQKAGARGPRPLIEPALDALKPALAREIPTAFDVTEAREIDRALAMAREFNLDPIVVGGIGAAERIADLQKAKARVIYSLNYPGGRGGAAGAGGGPPAGGGRGGGGGDSLRVMKAQANAPKVPAALAQAGIAFAFTSGGMQNPADFLRNAVRAVKEGNLTAEFALRALTLDAARIAGAADRVGTIERGKIANVIVTSGDLFEANTAIRHVFIDGRPVDLPAPAGAAGQGRGRGGLR